MRIRTYILLAGLLIIHLLLLVSLRFTAWPEMFSYPYLRNNGFSLYRDMIHPYPPILTMSLSVLYNIFGYRLMSLQVAAWTLILLSSVLVFLITNLLTKNAFISLLALSFYVFLQPFLEGNMLWFDLAIVPPILFGLLFALRTVNSVGNKRVNLFLVGLFLAGAIFIKQTAVIFFVLFLLFILLKRVKLQNIIYVFIGPVLFALPFLIRLLQEGAVGDFLRWTVIYPLTEWGSYPSYLQMAVGGREAIILALLIAPLFILIVRPRLFKDTNLQLLLLMFGGGLIATYPRFSFFHFQPALAFLVIIYAFLLNRLKKARVFLVSCFLFLVTVFIARPILAQDWQREARFYGQEDMGLAQIIKNAALQGEYVFLLGLPSGLYSMAGVLPPKRWTDNFGWYLEIPGVQEEIIARWEEKPADIIFWRTPSSGNWFDLGTYQPKKIAAWVEEHYTKEKEVKPGIWLWREK